MRISKSRFMAGVQCLKRLYLLIHEPGLAAQPDGANEATIEQGREVGLLVRQLFPGGVEVNGSGRCPGSTERHAAKLSPSAVRNGAFKVHSTAFLPS
jgi:hypothetical protein